MKKLHTGIAAAALAATGLACGTGAAHAEGTWPDQFSAQRVVPVAGATYLLGDYDTGHQADDGNGGTYDVTGSALVKIVGSTVTTIDLGSDAEPSAITNRGNTVYVAGSDDQTGDAELWTVSADGTVSAAQTLPDTGTPQNVAVSADGRVAVAGWDHVIVMNSDLTVTSTLPSTDFSSLGAIAFSPNGDTLQIAANDSDENDNGGANVDLWSLDHDAGDTTIDHVASQVIEPADGGSYASDIAVGADGTTYVTTINGDGSGLYAVKGTGTPAYQYLGFAQGLALSADGSTAYVAGDDGIFAVATDKLGTYGDNPNADYYAGGDDSVNAVALDAAGNVVIAESAYDYDSGTTSDQTLDVVSAPGAPSHVSVTRGDTWADISFSPAASSGSSAWTATAPGSDDTFIDYTVTLHDTTHPAKGDIVSSNIWDPSDVQLGYDDQQLVPGDAYAVSVTATNGLFTGPAATYSLAAYKAPAGNGTGHTTQPQPTSHPAPQPAKVTKIKAAKITSSSTKLTFSLAGVSNAPGKVKVFEGKKLIGKGTIKDRKLVLKLKKKLHKGKHKLTVKYAGSAQVAGFSKSVTVKVT